MFKSVLACAIASLSQAVKLQMDPMDGEPVIKEVSFAESKASAMFDEMPDDEFQQMFEPYFPNGLPDGDGISNFAPKAAFDVEMRTPEFTMIMINTTGATTDDMNAMN